MSGADSLFGYPPSNLADREPAPAWVARIMAERMRVRLSGERGAAEDSEEREAAPLRNSRHTHSVSGYRAGTRRLAGAPDRGVSRG